MTYLQLVNEVLTRLRESNVSTVTETSYSSLIGLFVNDAKRAVEDAWDWSALSTTITIPTVAGTTLYTVTGSGGRQRSVAVNDTTNKARRTFIGGGSFLKWTWSAQLSAKSSRRWRCAGNRRASARRLRPADAPRAVGPDADRAASPAAHPRCCRPARASPRRWPWARSAASNPSNQ